VAGQVWVVGLLLPTPSLGAACACPLADNPQILAHVCGALLLCACAAHPDWHDSVAHQSDPATCVAAPKNGVLALGPYAETEQQVQVVA